MIVSRNYIQELVKRQKDDSMKNEMPYLLVESMLEEEVLCERVDHQDVEKCTDNFLMMRLRGTQISMADNGTIIYGWMVNIVSAGNTVIRLPLLLKVVLDLERKIRQVKILNEFKGSQGILCSKKFLQNRLESKLIGTDFTYANHYIESETELACIHLHEVLIGAISFYEYCLQKECKQAYESENNYCCYEENDVIVLGRKKSNLFEDVCTKIHLPNALNHMNFTNAFKLYLVEDQKMVYSQVLQSGEATQVVERTLLKDSPLHIAMLRNLMLFYGFIGKRIQCKSRFLFTCFYPGTFIGLLTQAVGLRLFSNNYVYFQQCLMNLQRKENQPKCIGAIKDYQEGVECFQLSINDLEG